MICVTDAPEQAALPVAHYWGQFPRALTYSVVGPFLSRPPEGCVYDSANDGRHAEAVALGQGFMGEICTNDWGRTLAQLGGATAGLKSSFPLSERNSSPVSVSVDGVDIAPVDSRGAEVWAHDLATNSVRFSEFYKPPFGSEVVLRYDVACVP